MNGTLTVNAVNGVATFTGLSIDQAGDSNTLSVITNSLPSVTTDTFIVTPAAATQLVVGAPIAPVLTNGSFALDVQAEDPYGNVDPTFDGDVTIALEANPGSARWGEPSRRCRLRGGRLQWSDDQQPRDWLHDSGIQPRIDAGVSPTFNVTTDQLVVTTPPENPIRINTAFGLAVSAVNASGAVDTSFNGTMTIALDGNGSTGTLSGTLTVPVVLGTATFSGLAIDQPGDSYTLTVTSSSAAAPVTTGSLNVTGTPATHLVALTPENFSGDDENDNEGIVAGSEFGVEVEAEDAAGNLDESYNGSVTIALANNPSGATLGGTLTGTAEAGVRLFR